MASRSSFEEVIRLSLETEGGVNAEKLAAAIRKVTDQALAGDDTVSGFVEELDKLAKLDNNIASFVKLKAQLTDTASKLEAAKVKVVDLQLQFNQTENPTAKLTKELERARNELSRLTTEQNKQRAAFGAASGALAKAGVDTDKLATAQRNVRQEITNVADKFRIYATNAKAAGDNADKLGKSTRDFASSAKSASGELQQVQLGLGKLAAAAGAALAALKGIEFGGDLIAQAATIQQSMAEVQAVSGATAADFGKMRDAAEDAAERTGIATNDIIGGLGELARAGLSAEQAISALTPTLDLAQAGGLGLSEAVGITTTTLTQFGMQASEAGRVADVLAQAANSTQSSVQGLGLSLSYAAPLARQLGLGLEETTAIIGALADEGFRGERAGTALRNVFSQLLDPSSKFRDALNGLGIEGNDFASILEQLAEKGDAGKNALLALDSEARPAITALFAKGGESVRALITDLQNADAAAANTAAIIRDTLGNAWDRFANVGGNAVNELISTALNPLQDLLEDLAEQVRDFADSPAFDDLKESLSTVFTEGAEAVKQFLAEADFTQLVADFRTLASEAADNFTALRENISTVVTAVEAFGSGVKVFWNALQISANAAIGTFSQLAKVILNTGKTYLEFSNRFGLLDGQIAEVNEKIALFDRLQSEATKRGLADWEDLKVGAQNFAEAVSDGEQKVQEYGGTWSRIAVAIESAAKKAYEFATNVVEPAPEIEKATAKVAKGFDDVGVASSRVTRAIAQQWVATRQTLQIEATAMQLALTQALLAGDQETATSLQSKLDAINGQISTLTAGINAAEAAFGDLSPAADDASKNIGNSMGRATKALRDTADAAQGAAGGIGSASDAATAGNGVVGAYINRLVQLKEEFSATSAAAEEMFTRFQTGQGGGVGQSLTDLFQDLEDAGIQTRIELENASTAADLLSRDLREVGDVTDAASYAAIDFGNRFGGNLARAGEEAARLVQDIEAVQNGAENARDDLKLLDKATLDQLKSEAKAAADAVSGIGEEAKSALAELQSLNRELQDEADTAAGNESAVLEREHQDRLDRIEELARTAGAAGAAEAAEARRRSEEQFAREMAQIAAKRAAEREAAAERSNYDRQRSSSTSTATRTQGSQLSTPGGGITINITGDVLDPDALVRKIKPSLDRINRLTIGAR